MLFPPDQLPIHITPECLMDSLDRCRAALGWDQHQYALVVEEVVGDADEDTDFASRPLPPAATEHPPGSPEKTAVMRERAAAGYSVWHPDDAPPVGAGKDDHEEQTGRGRRNGAIQRGQCQSAQRDGHSIVIQPGSDLRPRHVADRVAETLLAHFNDAVLREVANAIWLARGVREAVSSKEQSRGFVVLGCPVEYPGGRRRRRRKDAGGQQVRQLTLWPEPEEVAGEAA